MGDERETKVCAGNMRIWIFIGKALRQHDISCRCESEVVMCPVLQGSQAVCNTCVSLYSADNTEAGTVVHDMSN